MSLARLLCLLDRHRPSRASVLWDGDRYAGACKHCGKPIRRLPQGGWRAGKTPPNPMKSGDEDV